MNAAKDEILQSIIGEINKIAVSETAQIEATFAFDTQLQKAIEVISNSADYNRILGK
ncbi:MAG: hypothetical protein IPG99_05435 [Ignavibacteria bacterium]|nr:hypothetical protein [Ignavibacteria bacterium]